MDLGEIEWCGMNWTDLAQDRDRWRTHMNTVMKLRLHKINGISLIFQQLQAFRKGHSSVELVGWLV
jgi:hypothetical protein